MRSDLCSPLHTPPSLPFPLPPSLPSRPPPPFQTEEAGKEVSQLQEHCEVEQHLRLIGQRIRSTLDRTAIVSTCLLELRDLLALETAALWMPTVDGRGLEMVGEAERRPTPVKATVPLKDGTVQEVSSEAPSSPRILTHNTTHPYVPRLHTHNIIDGMDLPGPTLTSASAAQG